MRGELHPADPYCIRAWARVAPHCPPQARQHYEEAVQRYVIDVLTEDQLAALNTIAETILTRLEKPHKP